MTLITIPSLLKRLSGLPSSYLVKSGLESPSIILLISLAFFCAFSTRLSKSMTKARRSSIYSQIPEQTKFSLIKTKKEKGK